MKNVAFLILSDLDPHSVQWPLAAAQTDAVRRACAPVLGFDPHVRLVALGDLSAQTGGETLILPAAFDFSLWERDLLGQRIAEERRSHPDNVIYHDDVDPGHPLLVAALGSQAARALGEIPPQRCGLILAASGHGDSGSRAQSYRLMRLLWEQMGFARAEVGFLRHVQPFLGHVLERCSREAMPWVVLFQGQWETEHVEYAHVIVENARRSQAATHFYFAQPPGAHPLLSAWYAQRITRLWQEKRTLSAARKPSVRKAPQSTECVRSVGGGFIAGDLNQTRMTEALSRILPQKKIERVLVKVTWHGYATGAYTDPAALDLLLSALPAPAIVLEGHTTSRNLGGAQFDWEMEAKENRAWIRQQDAEYLRRTGLQDVLTRHCAEYVNVTEAFWDEDAQVDAATSFVPRFLRDFRGCPLLSFAKFKGPTRLGISNLFGLIPLPLRSAWHGPNITWFAQACCDVAKTYGSLFELCGVVEALYSAVRWNRQGLYRSRWGNYDLIRDAGYITASRGLVSADILAARLQGQDVRKSAFFDVIRQDLGWDDEAATADLPEEDRLRFA